MSASQKSDLIEFTAGQIVSEPFTFEQANGDPIDLTGSTVHLMVKRQTSDPDSAALISAEQDAHSDAAAGETEINVDLSDLDEKLAVTEMRAVGIIWLIDASSQRIPYGPFDVRINPNRKRSFA